MACSGNKFKFIEKKSPMQSHILHFSVHENFLYIYKRTNPLSKKQSNLSGLMLYTFLIS